MISLPIGIYCNECGKELRVRTAEYDSESIGPDLFVGPCPQCTAAREVTQDPGGYKEGYDKGYAEGYEAAYKKAWEGFGEAIPSE